MPKFTTLNANFRVSTMVEHGTLTFWINEETIIQARDSIDVREIALPSGEYEYQWQVNGTQGLTRYSIRLSQNGALISGTGIGPKKLNNGNTDFGGGILTIS